MPHRASSRFYLSTCDLEGGNIALPDLDVLHARSDLVNDAAEFVTEDVALVHLDDGSCTLVWSGVPPFNGAC